MRNFIRVMDDFGGTAENKIVIITIINIESGEQYDSKRNGMVGNRPEKKLDLQYF